MRIRTFALLACCMLLPFAGLGASGPMAGVRQIEVKGDEGVAPKAARRPAVITSAEGLKGVFSSSPVRERLQREVDFRTEGLIVFAWSGPAGETITCSVRDEPGCKGGRVRAVTLTRQAADGGPVRDHLRLFVVPKGDGTRWRVDIDKCAK